MVEIWKLQKWAQVFVWIGANSITIYVADNIIDFYKLARRFAGGDVKSFFDSTFLYRRNIFLRL